MGGFRRFATAYRQDFRLLSRASTVGIGMGSDRNWASVVSLLHFDGADGSTTFTDQAGNTWTAVGNAQIDTAQSKFGGAAGLFDGSGDYLQATISNAVGTSDFTIEAFVRLASLATDCEIFCISDASFNTSTFNIVFETKTTGALRGSIQNGSGASNVDLTTASSLITTDVWNHLAFTASGSTAKLWINGVERASGAISGTRTNSRSDCRVGFLSNDSGGSVTRYLNGWVDELRITKGVARYTAGFNPPTSSFPNS